MKENEDKLIELMYTIYTICGGKKASKEINLCIHTKAFVSEEYHVEIL
jgi:hypothetical protein